MDNMELLVNNQAQKENDIHKVEQELAANNVQVNQNNILAQQNKEEEKKEDAHEVVFENININGMVEKDEEQHANVGAVQEGNVAFGNINVNNFVPQSVSNVSLNIKEEPVYVEKVIDHKLLKAQEMLETPMPRKIKLTRMQRFVRKIGVANINQRAEYRKYRQQEKMIQLKKNLLWTAKFVRDQHVKEFNKSNTKKVEKIMKFADKQGTALAGTHRLNRKNAFLKKMQAQGDEDNRKINSEGRIAISIYKREANGLDLDYSSMNRLLRGNKFSPKFQGSNKTFEMVKNESTPTIAAIKNPELKKQEYNKMLEKQSESKDNVKVTKDAINTINTFSLRQDMTLFRYAGLPALASMFGLKFDASEEEIDKRIKNAGKNEIVIRDRAFLSTTMFSDTARSFQHNPVHFRILGRKGTKAYNVSRLVGVENGVNVPVTSLQDEEQEMLLQARTPLRVLKIDTENVKGKKRYTVYLETIPQIEKRA